jgi:hypothetical protein
MVEASVASVPASVGIVDLIEARGRGSREELKERGEAAIRGGRGCL